MTIILTKDLNKNILRITYNFLNLPKEIMFMDGSYIHYTYDAAGTLLRKGYYVGEELTEIPGDDEEELTGFRLPDTHLMSVGDEEEEKELVEEEEEEIPYTDVIDYCGNCIYENGTLRRIFVEGGYITFDSSNQPVYHFYLKDHLGNNRVVANASGQAEQVNHYYPYGGLMAESTCGDVQRYKYNGKELDRMLGLDWYDYGARHYDGALTMWGTVDPLCENYYNISPYVYCGNNPINAFDPDGRNPIYDTRGRLLGCSSEGFTGQIYIYKGRDNIEFKRQNIETILKNDDLGNFMTFEAVEAAYTGNAKANLVSNIMTDIVRHAEGTHVFEYSFSISTLHKGRIGFSLSNDSHFTTEKRRGEDKIRIVAHDDIGKDYEATVENLLSSLIPHEWYSHGVKGYGTHTSNHRFAYENVMKDPVFYPKTTAKYKQFIEDKYNYYMRKEVIK